MKFQMEIKLCRKIRLVRVIYEFAIMKVRDYYYLLRSCNMSMFLLDGMTFGHMCCPGKILRYNTISFLILLSNH